MSLQESLGRAAAASMLAALVATSAARADDDPFYDSGHGTHLTVEALTDFPIDVGVRASFELPERVRLSASVGILPGPYVDAFNDVAVAAGAYPQSEADAIRAALQSSLIIRLHAGWRPFAARGFYFDVGYGLAALGGTESSPSVIGGGTGILLPTDPNSARGYQINSRLHMLDAEVGWMWLLPERFSVRAALGFAGTITSHTTVTPNFTSANPQQQQDDQEAAAQLDSIYTRYVFTPVFTVAAGFRFF